MISLLSFGQGLPFNANGMAHATAAPGGPVSITHSGSSTCSSTSCTITSQVIGATGDAVIVNVQGCADASCAKDYSMCTVTVTDGTNTYTRIAAASLAATQWNIYPFLATNATAGTYTITYAISGAACSMQYGGAAFADFHLASTTTPLDTAVTATATQTTTTPSITSAGNVSTSGEVGYAMMSNGSSAITPTGSYTSLTTIVTGATISSNSSLTAGATTTATGSETSHLTFLSLIAIKP